MTTPEYVKYFIDEEIVETSRKKKNNSYRIETRR